MKTLVIWKTQKKVMQYFNDSASKLSGQCKRNGLLPGKFRSIKQTEQKNYDVNIGRVVLEERATDSQLKDRRRI